MVVGDAVIEVLTEAHEPLSLNDLTAALNAGHLPTDARAVNASLLNMKGVLKSPKGSYKLDDGSGPPLEDIDDLPF